MGEKVQGIREAMKGPAFQIGDVVSTPEGRGTIVAVDENPVDSDQILYSVNLFGRNKISATFSEDELYQA